MENRKSNIFFKLSILLVAMDATITGIVSSLVPAIQESTNSSTYLAESIVTLPSIFTLLAILVSPRLTNRFGYKAIAILSLAMICFTGVLPMFFTNIYLILIVRSIFGMGIGLLNPIVYNVIAAIYSGTEQAEMIGYVKTSTNLVCIILTIVSGLLITISWRAAFLSYGLVGVVLILVILFFPNLGKGNQVSTTKETGSEKVPVKAFLYAICLLIMYVCFMTLNMKLTSLVTEGGYGDLQSATLMLIFINIAAMIGGILFGRVNKVVGSKLFPITLFLLAFVFWGISLSNNLVLSIILISLMSVLFTFLASMIIYRITDSLPITKKTLGSTFTLVSINIGIFAAPIVMGAVGNVLNYQKTSEYVAFCGGVTLLICLIYLIGQVVTKPKVSTIKKETEMEEAMK